MITLTLQGPYKMTQNDKVDNLKQDIKELNKEIDKAFDIWSKLVELTEGKK